MTYIINLFPEGYIIAKGCKELEQAIRWIFRNNDTHWLQNIIPLNYTPYLYISYEFDGLPYYTNIIKNEDLIKTLDFIKSENGKPHNIYKANPGNHHQQKNPF